MRNCCKAILIFALIPNADFLYAAQVDDFLLEKMVYPNYFKTKFINIKCVDDGYVTETGLEHSDYNHERIIEDHKVNRFPNDNLLLNILGIFSSDLFALNSEDLEHLSMSTLGLGGSEISYLGSTLEKMPWEIRGKRSHETILVTVDICTLDIYGRTIRKDKFETTPSFTARAPSFSQALRLIIGEIKALTNPNLPGTITKLENSSG